MIQFKCVKIKTFRSYSVNH